MILNVHNVFGLQNLMLYMNQGYKIPILPLSFDLETKAVLKQLNLANKKLAELKGIAQTIPNEVIIINTLTLQEAKDSSEVENIVTTNDELYKAELNIRDLIVDASAKEVLNYRQALKKGFDLVRARRILSLNDIISIQSELEGNKAGFRRVPGTKLKNLRGETVYTPPQDYLQIMEYMANLEQYINDQQLHDVDPLIKMAVIHHQFESIHPFYDGNGRTGRILSIIYLIISGALDLPILYLSRYITRNKGDYYRLIQAVRDAGRDNFKEWEEWILFILKGVEVTAADTIELVSGIRSLMIEYKNKLRPIFGKQYKYELLNNLFFHPYTKSEFIEKDMMVSKKTATKYLDKIVEVGLLNKVKIWRTNYYINVPLIDLFLNRCSSIECVDTIESVLDDSKSSRIGQ